jgi:uncharacterized SAM-binding protein YcdF (DUF218 family)
MFVFLSKFLPVFVYPLGLAWIFLLVALFTKGKPKWQTISLWVALALLWVGGSGWISTSLVRSLEWQYLPPEELPHAEVIVVLGGGTDSPQYPREQVELNDAADRIVYASWLYHQGAAPKLLLTGGFIPWMGEVDSSPAENMASVLALLGVPQDALILETQSLNTYENALYSRDILDSMGVDRIILVTSAQHMPRSVGLFEKQGLEVIPAPTDFSVTQASWERLWEPDLVTQVFNFFPSVSNLSATTAAMKEYLGIMVYKLRGLI